MKASVPPARLPELIDTVQAALEPDRDHYRRRYERVFSTETYDVFFVDRDHWTQLGERLGLERREVDAVLRAHRAQLLRTGRRKRRLEECETALEIREPLIIGV